MADTRFEKFTVFKSKVCGHFFFILLLDADWLDRQSPIAWEWSELTQRRYDTHGNKFIGFLDPCFSDKSGSRNDMWYLLLTWRYVPSISELNFTANKPRCVYVSKNFCSLVVTVNDSGVSLLSLDKSRRKGCFTLWLRRTCEPAALRLLNDTKRLSTQRTQRPAFYTNRFQIIIRVQCTQSFWRYACSRKTEFLWSTDLWSLQLLNCLSSRRIVCTRSRFHTMSDFKPD